MQKKLSDGSKNTSVATTPTTPMQNPLTAAIASIIPGVVTGTGNTPLSQKQAENSREFEYIENVHDNVSYSLWSIGNQRPSPQDKSNLKILVRQSIDGYVNTETSSLNVLRFILTLIYLKTMMLIILYLEYCFISQIGVSTTIRLRKAH